MRPDLIPLKKFYNYYFSSKTLLMYSFKNEKLTVIKPLKNYNGINYALYCNGQKSVMPVLKIICEYLDFDNYSKQSRNALDT